MTILKLHPNSTDWNLFHEVPENIYQGDSPYFQQPHKFDDDFLFCVFVVVIDQKAIARAALYFNPLLEYEGKRSAAIGYYDCVNDEQVATELLNQICKEALANDYDYILGPMNGSTWNSYRFSENNDFSNFLLEPYHHLYYNDQFKNFGFEVIANYRSDIQHDLNQIQPEVEVIKERLIASGLNFRNIDKNNFESELLPLYHFLTKVFKDNFLYTPISQKSFFEKYRAIGNLIDPQFVVLAEDESLVIRGLIFCYRDILNTNEKNLVVKTIARDSDKKWSGLGLVLGQMMIDRAREQKYDNLIHAFFKDTNASTRTSSNFSGNTYKTYSLYGKAIK